MRVYAKLCLEEGAMDKALQWMLELDELRWVTIKVIFLSWEWMQCLRNSYMYLTVADEPYAISVEVLEDSLKEVTLKVEKLKAFFPPS